MRGSHDSAQGKVTHESSSLTASAAKCLLSNAVLTAPDGEDRLRWLLPSISEDCKRWRTRLPQCLSIQTPRYNALQESNTYFIPALTFQKLSQYAIISLLAAPTSQVKSARALPDVSAAHAWSGRTCPISVTPCIAVTQVSASLQSYSDSLAAGHPCKLLSEVWAGW